MKERPILFSGPMVRAILEGRKTQTRRVCKILGTRNWTRVCPHSGGGWMATDGDPERMFETDPHGFLCPHGEAGDRLWVKETFSVPFKEALQWVYQADGQPSFGKWTPSIFMPRAFSRLTLELTAVRVERLQEITPDDCRAEGMPSENNDLGVRYCYGQLWNELNEKRGLGWDRNPWVWVLEFKQIKP